MKRNIEEVAAPKSEDEFNFILKHGMKVKNHPVSTEAQHSAEYIEKAKRLADYEEDEDEEVYESYLKERFGRYWRAVKIYEETMGESAFVAKAAHAKKDKKKKFKLGNEEFPVTIGDKVAKEITESFKTGLLSLNDGSKISVSKQDAKILNDMFDDLNPANKKKFEKILMTDKAGFEEILGFAKEAL